MANGILTDEATYFNDSEKYTGTSGKSANMWVIEDIYDFVKALKQPATIGDSYYLRLVNDIDFNDHSTYKRGISSAIYDNNNYYLYGDNHKIKNIVAINATSNILKFQHIEKVDFVNLVAVNCNVFPIAMINAENCDFGMFISSSKLDFSFDIAKIMDCTFNIKGKVVDSASLIQVGNNSTTFQACHFNFDVSISPAYIFTGATAYTNNRANYINCYFTGKINYTGSNTVRFSTNNSFTGCYFALEWTGIRVYNGGDTSQYSEFSGCFIDKELFNKNGESWAVGISGLTNLTTAQAQDADYLNSIGFLVIPVE